jgi:glycosyltransferase involved in cell wall biosynthesis
MLAAKGYTVSVFVPDDRVRDHRVVFEENVRIIQFNGNRNNMGNWLGYAPRLSFEFAAIVKAFIQKEGKPDCLESQEYLAIPYYIMQYKLLKYPEFEKIPILLTLHSPAFLYLYYNREGIYEFPNYWIGEMEMSCIQSADWIIAPSGYIVEEIKKHALIDEDKVSVIVNPYFPSAFTTGSISRNKIVFYGKLSPQKGVFELFSYFKALWDQGFPHGLTVIGGTDKVYYPEMKTMGQVIAHQYASYIRKGLIHFTGKIEPQQREDYLSDAHVILIPSRNDNLPYAAIEAMSIGKTVLASRQGGQAEIIEDGINGFIFDHEQPETFAEKLKQILSLDDDALQRIGMQAKQSVAERFNYDAVYDQKMPVIDHLRKNRVERKIFPFTRPIGPLGRPAECDHIPGLLSVVIPYFNMGAYIDECIGSILQSTYTHLEIIIVDDGSYGQENSWGLQKWKDHQSVTLVQQQNEGVASARNKGARLAKGEFLAFLDADDKIDPDYYSRGIAVLKQYENVFFVGSWLQFFGSKKGIWPTWNPEPPYILLHNSVNSSSLLYKRAAYLFGGIHDKAVDYGLEDYGSLINMLDHGCRGVVLPECLFHYRIRNGSMYRALTRHKLLHSYQYISSRHPRLYHQYATQLFGLLNANGPSFAYDNPSFGIRVKSENHSPNGMVNGLKTIVKRNPALKKMVLLAKGFLKV